MLLHPFRHPPEHPIENLVRQVHGLIDCVTGRDHAHVCLFLSRQSYARDHARAHVDQSTIRSGYVCVGIEHDVAILGEGIANIQDAGD